LRQTIHFPNFLPISNTHLINRALCLQRCTVLLPMQPFAAVSLFVA
jgi:hypothetical protein